MLSNKRLSTCILIIIPHFFLCDAIKWELEFSNGSTLEANVVLTIEINRHRWLLRKLNYIKEICVNLFLCRWAFHRYLGSTTGSYLADGTECIPVHLNFNTKFRFCLFVGTIRMKAWRHLIRYIRHWLRNIHHVVHNRQATTIRPCTYNLCIIWWNCKCFHKII